MLRLHRYCYDLHRHAPKNTKGSNGSGRETIPDHTATASFINALLNIPLFV